MRIMQNDMLQWILDASLSQPAEERTPRMLVIRILVVGFAAIHTSSMVS